MDTLKYDLYSSIEDIFEQLPIIEENAADDGIDFASHPILLDMLDSLEHQAAFWLREYTTKKRSVEEREQVERVIHVKERLIGALAINGAYGIHDECNGDTGVIKREIASIYEKSDFRMSRLYYEKSLDDSIEQFKHGIAQRNKIRFVMQKALEASMGAAGVFAAVSMIRYVGDHYDLPSRVQNGIIGLTIPPAILYGSSHIKGFAKRVGRIPSRWFAESSDKYSYPKIDEDEDGDEIKYDPLLESKLDYYARRDTEGLRKSTKEWLNDYDMKGKEDIVDMVAHVRRRHERMSLKHYGITLGKNKKTSKIKSFIGRVTGIDLVG